MPEYKIARTLVKSPPEIWAELQQAEHLAELLGDDAIKITKTEGETALEWAGSSARGRIEIEESSWGTKVKLTADVTEAVAEPEPVAVEPEPEPEPEPVAEEPELDPVAEEPEPEIVEVSVWQRVKSWFGTEAAVEPEPQPEPEPVAIEPDPEPEPEPAPVAEATAEPEPPAADSEPAPEPVDFEERMVALLDHLGSAHKRPFVNAG
ncbi:MAG: hypothetical protein ACRDKI_02145 [Solirubrobacterales bacterium]